MNDIIENVEQWAHEKGISGVQGQLNKLFEEGGELCGAVSKGHIDDIEKELGDCLVVLTIIANLCDTSAEICLQRAWDKISKRNGKTVNGVFVKESDSWPDDRRIDAIGQNGNDGLHYAQAHKAGVYEA